MTTGYFKGTSIEQDARFHSHDRKKGIKFPAIFDRPVQIEKVNVEVMKNWISKKLIDIIGYEDEVLINYASGHLDESELNPREMMISLNDMIEDDTVAFMSELWELLLNAQTQPGGIPSALVDSVKQAAQSRQDEKNRVIQVIQRAQHRGGERSYHRRDKYNRSSNDNFKKHARRTGSIPDYIYTEEHSTRHHSSTGDHELLEGERMRKNSSVSASSHSYRERDYYSSHRHSRHHRRSPSPHRRTDISDSSSPSSSSSFSPPPKKRFSNATRSPSRH